MRQITIVGTGLIGGSLALALKQHGFSGRVVGCDRPGVLEEASRRGAIDGGATEPAQSIAGSDVIVLATPVGSIIDLIERLGPVAAPHAVLTDVGSTKCEVLERAKAVFGAAAARRFLAGHPMAGKESGGIEMADPELFHGAVWLVTPLEGQAIGKPEPHRPAVPASPEKPAGSGLIEEYLGWIQGIGSRVVTMDAQRHDRLCAWISHLPQMLSTALAATLQDEFGDDPELHAIGGRALREMTRLGTSPYSMWRDIALTNTGNIQEALLRLEQRLAHLRENLRTRELEEEFAQARKFKKN